MSGRRRDNDRDGDPTGFDDDSVAKTVADDASIPDSEQVTQAPTPTSKRRAVIATGVRAVPLDDSEEDDVGRPVEAPSARVLTGEALRRAAAPAAALDLPPDTVLRDVDPPTSPYNPRPTPPPLPQDEPTPGPRQPTVRLVDDASSAPPPPPKVTDGPDSEAPHPLASGEWQLRSGDVVGERYTILRPLARGGMAEVYLAEQEGVAGFAKKVVIKRILPEFVQDPLFIEHFVREANLASSLTHDHVAQVYELGQDKGSYFIAMEYIPGVTLAELAINAWDQNRSIPVELILVAMSDAAQGLDYGWRHKGSNGEPLRLVHRDVSPDNLIINEHGSTKLLDYGVAKAATSQDLTMVGEIKGKLSYIAPEMFTDNVRDHRSDLYALGVTAFWMCTGKRPFEMTHAAALVEKLVREKPPAPRKLNPLLPPEVDALILRLLEKKPTRRFEDGRALSEHIHELLGAVRRVKLGKFVSEVTSPDSRRVIPASAPAAVPMGDRLQSSSDNGAWDKLKGRFRPKG